MFTGMRILQPVMERVQRSEALLVGGAALTVGLASGAGIWLFKGLIEAVHRLAFESLGAWLCGGAGWLAALVPVLGGLLVGLLVHFFVGHERHHGVAGIMEAAALAGGRLRYQRTPIKALGAALSIGFGASVGPEDPSVWWSRSACSRSRSTPWGWRARASAWTAGATWMCWRVCSSRK
jgi:CIC family chloride channel protein